MNNNNRGNNRRRGRNNRQGGGNGGQQLNRIDSRARGNAPQLLEKYRKLAQDAHLNGDRVQAEYYLQFADHYFRVIADARSRQEEQRKPRDERWQEGADEGDDSADFSVDGDFPSFDQPSFARQSRDERREERRPQRNPESEREDEGLAGEASEAGEAGEVSAEPNPFEPPENPFVRENRARGGLRPRREDRRPRREDRTPRGEDADNAPAGLDPSSLPPSISAKREDSDSGNSTSEDAAAEAKPRRTRAKRKPSADDAGESLESVN
ncbi:DUF4167 domain-containing protein [Novosphingobium sp.]|uniref:DUF4167 domain-containing protein n=1 Tax=Novosphingobium sp. TaxID=1874826 RepID=UPI0035B0907C